MVVNSYTIHFIFTISPIPHSCYSLSLFLFCTILFSISLVDCFRPHLTVFFEPLCLKRPAQISMYIYLCFHLFFSLLEEAKQYRPTNSFINSSLVFSLWKLKWCFRIYTIYNIHTWYTRRWSENSYTNSSSNSSKNTTK